MLMHKHTGNDFENCILKDTNVTIFMNFESTCRTSYE